MKGTMISMAPVAMENAWPFKNKFGDDDPCPSNLPSITIQKQTLGWRTTKTPTIMFKKPPLSNSLQFPLLPHKTLSPCYLGIRGLHRSAMLSLQIRRTMLYSRLIKPEDIVVVSWSIILTYLWERPILFTSYKAARSSVYTSYVYVFSSLIVYWLVHSFVLSCPL